jgi:hypothetical protein
MIEIRTLEIAGLASVLQALRLPFGKECRSEVDWCGAKNADYEPPMFQYESKCFIDEKDLNLLSTLVKRGTEHAKAIRGLVVYAEITAPIYFLREIETYRVGRERLASNSTMHQQCKGLIGEELVKAKSEMPMGTMQKTVDMMSYQCIRNIVKQREGHRLPEWKTFIDWARTLPFANELIFVGLDKEDSND